MQSLQLFVSGWAGTRIGGWRPRQAHNPRYIRHRHWRTKDTHILYARFRPPWTGRVKNTLTQYACFWGPNLILEQVAQYAILLLRRQPSTIEKLLLAKS